MHYDEGHGGWPDEFHKNSKVLITKYVPLVQCSRRRRPVFAKINNTNNCPWNGEACLFDIDRDPCEYQYVFLSLKIYVYTFETKINFCD